MNHLLAGVETGRTAALAVAGARDLSRWVEAHPDVFASRPFDAGMLHAIALANAVASPGATGQTLRVANRAALFVFVLDRLVDTHVENPARVADVIADCRAVTAGAPATTGPGLLLAEVRVDLIGTAFIDHWQAETDRMISAMERERRWLARAAPALSEYIDNSDNTGFVFVAVSHWLYTAAGHLARLDSLIVAARAGQKVLRLVNDLATYGRDITTGDLNALALVDRAAVDLLVVEAATTFQRLLRALEPECPDQCALLARQIGFATGFYEGADFWGDL